MQRNSEFCATLVKPDDYSSAEDVYQAVNTTYEAWQLFEKQPYDRGYSLEEWPRPIMHLMNRIGEAVVLAGADRQNGYNLRLDIRYRNDRQLALGDNSN